MDGYEYMSYKINDNIELRYIDTGSEDIEAWRKPWLIFVSAIFIPLSLSVLCRFGFELAVPLRIRRVSVYCCHCFVSARDIVYVFWIQSLRTWDLQSRRV